MRLNCLLPFIVASGLSTAAATLDFSATIREYIAEGITYHEVVFHDDEQSIRLELPGGWECRGQSARLKLTSPRNPYAEGTIEALDLPAAQPLDAAETAAFVQRAIDEAPPASRGASVVQQGLHAIMFGGAESFGVTISYQALGYTFHRSSIVINLPRRRLLLRFTAPEKDFATLNPVFQTAVRSWETK